MCSRVLTESHFVVTPYSVFSNIVKCNQVRSFDPTEMKHEEMVVPWASRGGLLHSLIATSLHWPCHCRVESVSNGET